MAIRVTIPEGQSSAKTSDLYQWDYGQVLEIEAPDNLPAALEVHFACRGMSEAVIHACSATNKLASVRIPDQCLETGNEITAWVYEINGTMGRTLYRITIPVIARTRPSRGESTPVEVQDPYTQMITAVNEAVGQIVDGRIVVAKAENATSAESATQANNAASASFAVSANAAQFATVAERDQRGDVIHEKYVSFKGGFTQYDASMAPPYMLPAGSYQFKVRISDVDRYAILDVASSGTSEVLLDVGFGSLVDPEFIVTILQVVDGVPHLWFRKREEWTSADHLTEYPNLPIFFRKLN